ncbi:MAG: phosphoenolpyruvate carboxylase [Edaphocola sp.]
MNIDVGASSALQKFNELVGTRFQLYNSLFSALPFHRIEKTGVLLSLFLIHCEEGYQKKLSPEEIIDTFASQYTGLAEAKDIIDLLFRFVQYAERQIVLFDALEDAAFTKITDRGPQGMFAQLLQQDIQLGGNLEHLQKALAEVEVRLVLTAHPTQFYPGEVLGILHDLSNALAADDTELVNGYLKQLGRTPFMKEEKPSPYEEALNMMWFLQNTFYPAAGGIVRAVKDILPQLFDQGTHSLLRMGFWPGGDRDGNQFVQADTTIKVAEALRERLLRRYYHDVRIMRRRLTFKGVAPLVAKLEEKIFKVLFVPNSGTDLSAAEIISDLNQIKEVLEQRHASLFVDLIDDMLGKVQVFGMFFATLDIRQDSSVHTALLHAIAQGEANLLPENYASLPVEHKMSALFAVPTCNKPVTVADPVRQDVLDVMAAMAKIQNTNGESGCNRYIISHATSVESILEVYALFKIAGWQEENLTVDIVPLFETIQDLQMAASVMETLYANEKYGAHLQRRGGKQTIMLGFSDGTKDGGYLMANWSIYKAKEALTSVSRKYGIEVLFFDGRGGPPARGGGKTQKFYASMGSNIASNEIQLTIQGQTVSSNFGTIDTARYNMEQMLQAGIFNKLYASGKPTLTEEEDALLGKLSEASFDAYVSLKDHPLFLEYLSEVSPLRYYANTNIGSRPSKRNNGDKITMDSLRAIPFVGSWSQLKQNVSGYYGLGTALKVLKEQGNWAACEALYNQSAFFKALVDNCEMALKKCYFPLTAYLSDHPRFGELWNKIHDEYELTVKMLLELADQSKLMEKEPVGCMSIQMRERIVLPLVTIQQFGLIKLNAKADNGFQGQKEVLEKLVTRCSFGIINAGRNSA